MLPISAPGDLIAELRESKSLALAKLSPAEPATLGSVIDELAVDDTSVELRGTTCVDGIPYGVLVFTSAPSTATTVFGADPKAVLLGVARILEFCHSVGLVHGNLNLDAISVLGSTVIVSGFEHCGMHPVNILTPRPESGGMGSPPPGNMPSMARELIDSGIRTPQTDVYAFGVLMFRVYAGEYPFASRSTSSWYISAGLLQLWTGKRPGLEAIQHKHFTDKLGALMNECWAQEPSGRPTMASVRTQLAQMV